MLNIFYLLLATSFLQICLAQSCQPNAHYEDCAPDQPTCTSLVYFPQAECSGRCVCDSGYIDDGNGTCILVNSCPQIGNCQGNRVVYMCHACGSYETTCSTIGIYPPCAQFCTVGCFCPGGYVLNNGVCILPEQCCKPNGYLPKTCTNPPCKCICNPGYVLDANDNCVIDCRK